MRRLLSVFLLAVLVFPGLVFAQAPTVEPFPDVPEDHPNYFATLYLKGEGVVEGYEDGTFRPEDRINRAEFTKIVIESVFEDGEILGCDPSTLDFSDVNEGDWFETYVCLAKENGVIDGYADGTFRPYDEINYAESSKILSESFDLEAGLAEQVWYEDYVTAMGEVRSIPVTIETFHHLITRGEMAEMVYRLANNVVNKTSHTYESLAADFDWFAPRRWEGSVHYHELKYFGDEDSYRDTDVTYEFLLEQNDQGEMYLLEMTGQGTQEEKMFQEGRLHSYYSTALTYEDTFYDEPYVQGYLFGDGSYSFGVAPYYFDSYVDKTYYNPDGSVDRVDPNHYVSFLGAGMSGNWECEVSDFSNHLVETGISECLTDFETALDGLLEFSFESRRYGGDPLQDGVIYEKEWEVRAL